MNQAGDRGFNQESGVSEPNLSASGRLDSTLCAGCQSRRDRFPLVCDLPSLPRSSSSEVHPGGASRLFNSLLSRLSVAVVILLRLVNVVKLREEEKLKLKSKSSPLLPLFTALPLSASLTTSLRLHLHLLTKNISSQPQRRRHRRQCQRQRRRRHGCQGPALMGLTAVNYGVHPALAPLPEKSTQTHVQG